MAISLIQTGTISAANGTAVMTFPGNLTAGNTLIVAGQQTGLGGTLKTISDNLSNSYTTIYNAASAGGSSANMYFNYANLATGGVGTLTLVATAGASISAIAREYSGLLTVSSFDVKGSAAGSSAAVNSGTTGVTAQANELAVAAAYINGTTAFTFDSTYSNGTGISVATGNTQALALEDIILNATGAQVGTFGITSHGWRGAIATFIAAPPINPRLTPQGVGGV